VAQTNLIEKCLDNSIVDFAKDETILGEGNSLIDANEIPAVFFDGVSNDPTKRPVESGAFAGMFLDIDFLPALCQAASLGQDSIDEETGIYQINIYERSGNGTIKTKNLLSKLLLYYKRKVKFTYEGVTVRIMGIKQEPRLTSGAFIQTPVSIRFHSFTD
jgi:hypothetical protein